jgi:hypothetical protein
VIYELKISILFSQHFSAARTGNLHANPYEISVNKVRELKDIAKEKVNSKTRKCQAKSVSTSLKSPCHRPGKLMAERC